MQMISTTHLHDNSFSIPPALPSFSPEPNTTIPQPTSKKKRNLPGTPDPDAEVIALSPKSLMATNRFVCEICNKGFQRDQNLQLHRRGHNLPWKLRQRSSKDVVRKKVYICPETGCVHHDPSRALGDLTGIKKHFSRKHGEKKWKCDKCSKKYAVKSDWKAHTKTCGTREYKCDCGTLFSRKDSFITHRAFCDALLLSDGSARTCSNIPANNNNDLEFKSNSNESSVTLNNPRQPGTLYGGFGQERHDQSAQFASNLFGSDHRMLPVWRNQPNPHHHLNDININMADNQTVHIASSSSPIPSSDQFSSGFDPQRAPMSATALLQKAALMGSTSSNPSLLGAGCGLMRSSMPAPNTTMMSPLRQDSPLNMGRDHGIASSSALDQLVMRAVAANGRSAGVTRDFLGVDGPFLPPELPNFPSFGSAPFGHDFHNDN